MTRQVRCKQEQPDWATQTPWNFIGAFFPAVTNPSQTTFFGHNCKIVDPFDVNSFAKLYFFRKRPFHLPPHQRVIRLPFPEEKWNESK